MNFTPNINTHVYRWHLVQTTELLCCTENTWHGKSQQWGNLGRKEDEMLWIKNNPTWKAAVLEDSLQFKMTNFCQSIVWWVLNKWGPRTVHWNEKLMTICNKECYVCQYLYLTSLLAVRLLVGPQPCGLAHPLLWANDLVASVTGVDGTVTKVAPSLVNLTVVRVK